jgi:hypothetical protein
MKDVKQYTEYSICIDIVNKINVKTGEITHAVQYYCYISAFYIPEEFFFIKFFFLANCHHFASVMTCNLQILASKSSKINRQLAKKKNLIKKNSSGI